MLTQNDIESLVADCRLLEVDSGPDGYPAIQMRQVSMLCDAIENAIPALDRLQDRLEQGAKIKFQDNRWCLFQEDGELICSGKTVRMMLINLIFTDC